MKFCFSFIIPTSLNQIKANYRRVKSPGVKDDWGFFFYSPFSGTRFILCHFATVYMISHGSDLKLFQQVFDRHVR